MSSAEQGAILVTGGAGYVGSHTVKYLRRQKRRVVVYDDLIEGHKEALGDTPCVVGDLSDTKKIRGLCRDRGVTSAIHFAARCYVGESVHSPRRYFRDNVVGSLSLMEALVDENVKRIVFSSSCAVYGVPDKVPIKETNQRQPINPYGWTKFAVEDMLLAFSKAYGLESVALRYFNAAGSDPEGELGEWHEPETHLIPLALRAAMDQNRTLNVFGDDYPTRDGTCIRDYVHVLDLASAHERALCWLEDGRGTNQFNLGTGRGFSVREVIHAAEKVSGSKINVVEGPRREGDPPELVADNEKAVEVLGWSPQFTELETIVQHAWNWLSRHPEGYATRRI